MGETADIGGVVRKSGVRRWAIRNGATVLAAAALALVPSTVVGQVDDERAGARAAAQAGLDAFDAQKWAQALDYFTRAETMLHAPVHLYFIGYSRMKLGQLVGAREAFLKLKNEVIPANSPKAFRDAQADAAKELVTLEPRIPTLTIVVVPEAAEGLVLSVDGKDVSGAIAGIPKPIDPGPHALGARAKGLSSDPVRVTLTEGKPETVTLTLKPVAAGATPAPPVAAGSSAPATQDQPAPEPAPTAAVAPGGRNLRTPAYVAFGVGAVGIVAGTVFVLRSSSKRDEAADLCPGGGCRESKRGEVESLSSDATSAGRLAVVSFAVGGAAAAAGVAMLLLSAPATPKEGAVRVAPILGPGSAGLAGTF
jgi:hypothetical protein